LNVGSDFTVATGNRCPLLLCYSVAMGIDDVIFRLLLLTSQADDVRVARRYYVAWSL
jgi:hypothetical protein